MILSDIERSHIANLIRPIWETKNPTAKRVLNTIQKILQRATKEGLRDKANPAVWKDDLELSFPKASKVHNVQHHRAIDWRQLPQFVQSMMEFDDPTGSRPEVRCMLFMILTVSRPQEARLVDWKEIDLNERVWTQPEGKYKSTRMWQIPLCTSAIQILRAQESFATQKGRIFSSLNGAPIHDKYLSSLPDALGFDAVAHGFRATFRTWGQKHQKEYSFSEEELELSMKHCDTVGCRAAYARDQLLPERRRIIRAFETWIMKGEKCHD